MSPDGDDEAVGAEDRVDIVDSEGVTDRTDIEDRVDRGNIEGADDRTDSGDSSGSASSGSLRRGVQVTDDEFEALVDRAWQRIPDQFKDELDNVVIVIEEEAEGANLLGLYQGVPVTSRSEYFGTMPDRITIFQGPLQRMCRTVDELAEQVYVTLVHEIGHYFGLDDDRLHELNWG